LKATGVKPYGSPILLPSTIIMNIKNQHYLDKLRQQFKYTDKIGKSDIEIVREDSRRLAYGMPTISALFVLNIIRLIDLQFDRDPPTTFHSCVTILLVLMLGFACVMLPARYRRSESCRSELEDELVKGSNVVEQATVSDR